MATVINQRQVASTWANKSYFEKDSNGFFPLNPIPTASRAVAASETLDPDAAGIVIVSVTAAARTITLPADCSRYVGKTYTIFGNGGGANNLVISATAGLTMYVPGVTTGAGSDVLTSTVNTQPTVATLYFDTATTCRVLNFLNLTAS